MKGTPGPWYAHQYYDPKTLWMVTNNPYPDARASCVRDFSELASDIVEADARLIAAAPALLEAIEKETADHKPSVATGLPCKCFLCDAKRRARA